MQAHDEYITYLVRSANGIPLLKSHDVNLSVFPDKPQLGLRSTATHRLYGISAVSNTIFIEVAEPLKLRQQTKLKETFLFFLHCLVWFPLILIVLCCLFIQI